MTGTRVVFRVGMIAVPPVPQSVDQTTATSTSRLQLQPGPGANVLVLVCSCSPGPSVGCWRCLRASQRPRTWNAKDARERAPRPHHPSG